jgi:hypothetical protein
MINVETKPVFPALPVPDTARVHPDAARRVLLEGAFLVAVA